MDDCIFCKIVRGEIPAAKVYEDTEVLAFLDITPVNPGHVLVVPKAHFEILQAIPDPILSKLIVVVKKIAGGIRKATRAEGINIGMNNGAAAGQEVPHAHIHVMPRFKDDGYKLWHGTTYPQGEMEETAKKILAALKYSPSGQAPRK